MDGARLRLTGLIEPSPRGPLLKLEDGTRWRLVGEPVDPALIGRQVLVEGVVNGPAIEVDYLAERETGETC